MANPNILKEIQPEQEPQNNPLLGLPLGEEVQPLGGFVLPQQLAQIASSISSGESSQGGSGTIVPRLHAQHRWLFDLSDGSSLTYGLSCGR